jgi:phage baseplate assembly protein W
MANRGITAGAQKPIYIGFSTEDFLITRTFVKTDVNIVKQDLVNHIFTRKGERVMMGSFGTIIPDLVFEPLDDYTIRQVHDEVLSVINFDPRVQVINFAVTPDYDNHAITVSADLLYLELNITDNLNLNITFQQ